MTRRMLKTFVAEPGEIPDPSRWQFQPDARLRLVRCTYLRDGEGFTEMGCHRTSCPYCGAEVQNARTPDEAREYHRVAGWVSPR